MENVAEPACVALRNKAGGVGLAVRGLDALLGPLDVLIGPESPADGAIYSFS